MLQFGVSEMGCDLRELFGALGCGAAGFLPGSLLALRAMASLLGREGRRSVKVMVVAWLLSPLLGQEGLGRVWYPLGC